MVRGARARREALEAALEAQKQAIAAGLARRNTLLLRQAVIGLMARCMVEIADHKRRFGFDDAEERAQLEAFRASCGAAAADHGGGGLWELDHHRGGGSLLQLERATREDVEFCRTATFEQAAARLAAVIGEGAARLAALPSGSGPTVQPSLLAGGAAASERARVLEEVYDGYVRCLFLLMIWQPDIFMRIDTRSLDNGRDLFGEVDAPQAKWDAMVRDAGLSMEQVLLLLDARRLANARYGRVRAERAALLAELAEQRLGLQLWRAGGRLRQQRGLRAQRRFRRQRQRPQRRQRRGQRRRRRGPPSGGRLERRAGGRAGGAAGRHVKG